VLTIDLDIQQAAEESLERASGRGRARCRGRHGRAHRRRAGDGFVAGHQFPDYAANDPARIWPTQIAPANNRATQENYAPGSIFKPIIGLAALDNGLDPDAMVDNPGYVYVGRRHIKDLAPPGQYNFRRAIIFSSNTYFITIGLRTGIEKMVRMAKNFILAKAWLADAAGNRGHFPD
jgi:penicillin-binding protein 2